MRNVRTGVVALTVILGVGWACGPVAAQEAPGSSPSTQARQTEIRALASKFRRAYASPERQVETLAEMAALGPEGVEAIGELFLPGFEKLAATLPEPNVPEELQGRIERLQEGLASLRAKPELSKEDLQKVGLPALEELTNRWNQRQRLYTQQYARLSGTRKKVAGQLAVLRLAQESPELAAAAPIGDYLVRAESLYAKTGPPVDKEAAEVRAQNLVLLRQVDPGEASGMKALNNIRVMCGLRPLLVDLKLVAAARGHSKDMKQGGFFSHDSPVPGKAAFTDRAVLAGTTALAENIYTGGATATSAIKAWFLSPGHHKNMLNGSHRRQGLGREASHWTHLFGQ